jgi:hypothetical protein
MTEFDKKSKGQKEENQNNLALPGIFLETMANNTCAVQF